MFAYLQPSLRLTLLDHEHMRQRQEPGLRSDIGLLLFDLWKFAHQSQSILLMETVEDTVQTLISDAIHSGSTKQFNLLRMTILAFVDFHHTKAAATMVDRVFRPVLWRALKCANATVRLQSSILLFDAFPFQDSAWSAEESDRMVQQQFDAMTDLLLDTDHHVRAAAVKGVSTVLTRHWDCLPTATTTDILGHFIRKLSCDSAAPPVRLAVFEGLAQLLEQQPLSHPLLAKLLPCIKRSAHDKCEKVRVAVLKLLLQVTTFVLKILMMMMADCFAA